MDFKEHVGLLIWLDDHDGPVTLAMALDWKPKKGLITMIRPYAISLFELGDIMRGK